MTKKTMDTTVSNNPLSLTFKSLVLSATSISEQRSVYIYKDNIYILVDNYSSTLYHLQYHSPEGARCFKKIGVFNLDLKIVEKFVVLCDKYLLVSQRDE